MNAGPGLIRKAKGMRCFSEASEMMQDLVYRRHWRTDNHSHDLGAIDRSRRRDAATAKEQHRDVGENDGPDQLSQIASGQEMRASVNTSGSRSHADETAGEIADN